MSSNRIEERTAHIIGKDFRLTIERAPVSGQDQSDSEAFFIQGVDQILKGKAERTVTLEKLTESLSWMRGDSPQDQGPIAVNVGRGATQIVLSWRAGADSFQLGLRRNDVSNDLNIPTFTQNGEEIPLSEDLIWNWEVIAARGKQVISYMISISA